MPQYGSFSFLLQHISQMKPFCNPLLHNWWHKVLSAQGTGQRCKILSHLGSFPVARHHLVFFVHPPPPFVQAQAWSSTGTPSDRRFPGFFSHSFRGHKCNVTRLCSDCRAKRGLDHACGSSSCSYQPSACNCNPMPFLLI
jgi:hypothetical protein